MRARSGGTRARATWRERLRPPRRLRLLRPGGFLLVGVLGLGLATLNTGNNLLYLLLGALLGVIVLSGWLSEETLRPLEVTRILPRSATAGQPVRLHYRVRHTGRRGGAYTVELREAGRAESAYLPSLAPGTAATVTAAHSFARRGVYRLDRVTLATSFPFGLFVKERDVRQAAELVVWPASRRPSRPPRLAGGLGPNPARATAAAAGAPRGEFRGLRPYRPGDDPRDVHWRSAARLREPIVREYDRDTARSFWLCLDLRGEDGGDREEAAIEVAAGLVAAAAHAGESFGFATPDLALPPATGTPQLHRALDALARARFRADAPAPPRPPAAGGCVLVTAGEAGPTAGYADVFSGSDE